MSIIAIFALWPFGAFFPCYLVFMQYCFSTTLFYNQLLFIGIEFLLFLPLKLKCIFLTGSSGNADCPVAAQK
jgi:hypothetical protein